MSFACAQMGCSRRPVGQLQARHFCISHLISTCHRRLNEFDDLLRHADFKGAPPVTIRRILLECMNQVVSQALRDQDLSNHERAQLLGIVLCAGDLLGRVRRSPRTAGFMAVRLRGRSTAEPWMEETVTEVLSKHGAMLRCLRRCPQGGPLEVSRLDTGHTALARVAWQEKDASGLHKLGIEILNHSNFWN